MTKFTKYINIADKLPENHPLVDSRYVPLETDTAKFNKRSLADLDSVMDEVIKFNPEWRAKLEAIINES